MCRISTSVGPPCGAGLDATVRPRNVPTGRLRGVADLVGGEVAGGDERVVRLEVRGHALRQLAGEEVLGAVTAEVTQRRRVVGVADQLAGRVRPAVAP